ncbi:MAG: glycosyltransferase family 4 protein [Burkholderiaceae bacterium]
MPRIVFLNRFFHPDLSASSQMLSDLAFGLAKRGADVHIITSRLRYDDPAARLPARERINGVTVHRIWTSGFGRRNLAGRAVDYLSFYLSAFGACVRILKPGDTLVAKTDPPMISVIGALAARLRGAELVNWLQDLFPEVAAAANIRPAKGRSGRFLQAVRDWSLRRARVNVAIGQRMHSRLLERGFDPASVTNIENWAGDELRPIPREDNPLRRQWRLENQFVVGYSGNMGEAHEFDTILDAAEQLKSRKNIRFLFIGAGKHLPYIKQAMQERGLHNIILQPYQPRERLSESLSAADVHLMSLRPDFEGLIVPSKFYGISAVGRPCLHVGAIDGELQKEIVRKNRFEKGDSQGLAERILDLASRPEECARLGAMRRDRFLANHTLAHGIERWASALRVRPQRVETRLEHRVPAAADPATTLHARRVHRPDDGLITDPAGPGVSRKHPEPSSMRAAAQAEAVTSGSADDSSSRSRTRPEVASTADS